MVAAKKKEFLEMIHVTSINPGIFGLFEDHWVRLCSAENDVQYEFYKAAFEDFIKKLFETANAVNNLTVTGIPYVRQLSD